MSDALGDLMDRYYGVYKEVEEGFKFWEPYMLEDHYRAVLEYICSTLVLGARSEVEYMWIVSPTMVNALAFSGKVKMYLPNLHVVTSREGVSNESYVYIHNERMRGEERSVELRDVSMPSLNCF
jgi:hypothetical protein